MAQVRIGHSLCDGEKNYITGRKLSVQQCLVKNKVPCTLSKVPNIAILGSGGGQRAMVGMLGSLSQMGEQGLLDAALYISGVSGSTWCMASLYEKTNWSSDLKQMKIVAERLGHDDTSMPQRLYQLIKYYQRNENFSMTDAWAALVVPRIIKKIDKSTLSNYQTGLDKDPYPIFTVINQDSKDDRLLRESFFELTPHEAGYTLAGAFVETSSFGSIFNKGVLTEKKTEMDMTYLQGVCGSALAEKEDVLQQLNEWLGGGEKEEIHLRSIQARVTMDDGRDPTPLLKTANELLEGERVLEGLVMQVNGKNSTDQKEQTHALTSSISQSTCDSPEDLEIGGSVSEELVLLAKTLAKAIEQPLHVPVERASNAEYEHLKQLIDDVKSEAEAFQSNDGPTSILDMLELYNLLLDLGGEEGTPLMDESTTVLTALRTGRELRINEDEGVVPVPTQKSFVPEVVSAGWTQIYNGISHTFRRGILAIVERLHDRGGIWGVNYNYLHNMNAPHVDPQLLKSKTSNFVDAGLLVNSPYMSALRAEREIDLIISFDFSEGNPMETLTETAKECEELGIPFPAIHYPDDDVASTKSFYVFKGVEKAPTVIHMPLFNVENCGSELEDYREKYSTAQSAYSPEMIEKLMEKAGENVINNKEKLLREIASIVKQK